MVERELGAESEVSEGPRLHIQQHVWGGAPPHMSGKPRRKKRRPKSLLLNPKHLAPHKPWFRTLQERSLLEEGIKRFPTFEKFYLMLGQLEERVGRADAARVVYRWAGAVARTCLACIHFGCACFVGHASTHGVHVACGRGRRGMGESE